MHREWHKIGEYTHNCVCKIHKYSNILDMLQPNLRIKLYMLSNVSIV